MLIFSFFLSFTALIVQAAFPSYLPILAFSPFLTLCMMKKSFLKALWISFATGAFFDLFSNDPIGIHALNYTLVCLGIYRFKQYFLEDRALHLAVFTALFSFFSTILQSTLLFLFDRRVLFDGKWLLIDFASVSMTDALYAFVWMAAPISLLKITSRAWKVFWLKKKNRYLKSL